MTDIEDIGTGLAVAIKAVLNLDKRLSALEGDGMQKKCGEAAKANGWHDAYNSMTDPATRRDHIITKTMLIVSELAEAVEELRDGHTPTEVYFQLDGKPEGFSVELADAVIRSYDLAEMIGVDLDSLIEEKLEYNKTRGQMHNGKVV